MKQCDVFGVTVVDIVTPFLDLEFTDQAIDETLSITSLQVFRIVKIVYNDHPREPLIVTVVIV